MKVFKPDIRYCFFQSYEEYEQFRNRLKVGECIRLPNMEPFTEAIRRLAGVLSKDYQSVVAVRTGKEEGFILDHDIEYWLFDSWEEMNRVRKMGILLPPIHPFTEWIRHKAGITSKEYTFILAVKTKRSR